MLRFNYETGKVHALNDGYVANAWFQYEGWVPYYTIAGDYLGCKVNGDFYSPLCGFVSTYEELAL